MFQAGGLVVVLVEVIRKAYLASIVPVVVNAILNEHQVIVDIIAFVSKGDFPRSRLGEKQRGKILASWVTRKMRTIAQFGIRDADGADSQITEVAEPRSGVGSIVGKGSSLRKVESASGGGPQGHDYRSLPVGISEMPAIEYESSIVESPPIPTNEDRNDTPTETRINQFSSPADEHNFPFRTPTESLQESTIHSSNHQKQSFDSFPISPSAQPLNSSPAQFDFTSTTSPKFRYNSSNSNILAKGRDGLPSQTRLRQDAPPVPPLPAEYGGNGSRGGEGGKLRITNADSDDEAEWPKEAIMHMNLASGSASDRSSNARVDARVDARGNVRDGTSSRGWDAYNGSGYGNAM